MSGDDGHLRVPAGKPVTRGVLPRPGFTPHSSMDWHRNEGAGEAGYPRENPQPAASSGTIPASAKPGSDPAGNRTGFAQMGGEQSLVRDLRLIGRARPLARDLCLIGRARSLAWDLCLINRASFLARDLGSDSQSEVSGTGLGSDWQSAVSRMGLVSE
ncbi:hypothetical protein PR048_032280 [Dryococelus australis]|uniref:Uncharacterized protein n=1 Tax=Dryococelus australis TaxID=614101 RepID=A0ABQ9G1S5_9NEOP|nr:hypothetical protein PR048_032280 [Dryococelus australis]